MFKAIAKKIVGTKNARELKKIQPIVARINELEANCKTLSDVDLAAKTGEFKQRLTNGAPLDDILPEAFAVVRETGRRVLNMRHYDVQLIGGMVLHRGTIAEMKTGEGKTLVATLPLYLNALQGRGVHLVTVNDYLAQRDAEWMGKIYNFLGLSVGVIYHDMPDRLRKKAYQSDITYGQNNEFGFDYLRDNMKDSIDRYVQRELHYAIVDEVDSILIDEARTPLIISGPAEQSADLYRQVNQVIPFLKKDVDYTVDEKAHSAMLTDEGVERVEKRLGISNLYDPANIQWLHHVTQALSAHTLYKRDVNYLVLDGKVVIIDEHTGRPMPGRRWSDGLHQAVEAKENVPIEDENQTLATITFQNYFRMYKKLAGMTGTAETEAEEFFKIYKLDVMVIPTNKPITRFDNHDVVYKSEQGKFKWVIEDILARNAKGQPILVGTTSVEKSEVLSKILKKRGISHSVLNAKHHGNEALTVAQAGRKGAITISTNMAGRGTDILLGGNAELLAKNEVNPEEDPERFKEIFARYREQCAKEREEVLAAGGLYILGTERHEARRIDNQLRGRAGRQGDVGESKFYLSLEDDLLRVFGSERIQGLMERLGMNDDEPIEHRFVSKAIENAQKKVEGHNFDIRKHLLEYDNVMNDQRRTIYSLRKQVLEGRYLPELSDEEKKNGKVAEAPSKSGKWTIEALSDAVRPQITEIINSFFAAKAQQQAQRASDPAAASKQPELTIDALIHELYRFFGAVVDLKEEQSSADRCIDKSVSTVAASLVQQRERILDLCDLAISNAIELYCPAKGNADEWDLTGLEENLSNIFNTAISVKEAAIEQQAIAERVWEHVEKQIEARETEMGLILHLYFSRHLFLDEIDHQWIEHLKAMDQLREGISLRGYGQRDPKQEYKKEGYSMFVQMMDHIQANVINKLFHIQVEREQQEELPEIQRKERKMTLSHGSANGGAQPQQAKSDEPQKTAPIRRNMPRIGRNDPCPCGSGKKYKRCHMLLEEGGAQESESV